MDSSIITSYRDALSKQKSLYEGYIADKTNAIALPADKKALNPAKKNFNTKSGVVFGIIGIIAFIVGLIMGIAGIWISGATAISCGVYLYIKGKQELEQDAYNSVGDTLVSDIDGIVAYVSKGWTEFIKGQNASLRKSIIGSTMSVDDKAANVNKVTDTAWYHVDMDAVSADIKDIDATENLPAYHGYLGKVKETLTERLDLAARAQSDIYDALTTTTSKDVSGASTAASATTSTSSNPKP